MKRKLVFILLAATLITGCGTTETKIKVEEAREPETYYVEDCRYYCDGSVVLSNGEVYEYFTDIVSEVEVYNNMPVWAGFHDNGTDDTSDDVVLGLVYDRETALYDALYEEFSEVEEWNVTRENNDINIKLK